MFGRSRPQAAAPAKYSLQGLRQVYSDLLTSHAEARAVGRRRGHLACERERGHLERRLEQLLEALGTRRLDRADRVTAERRHETGRRREAGAQEESGGSSWGRPGRDRT